MSFTFGYLAFKFWTFVIYKLDIRHLTYWTFAFGDLTEVDIKFVWKARLVSKCSIWNQIIILFII